MYERHIIERSGDRLYNDIATDVVKTSLLDYHEAARKLLWDMQTAGFRKSQPIDVDCEGEILGGAHRLACAIALGIDEVPVLYHEQRVWAPDWGRDWFIDYPSEWLRQIDEDYARMSGVGRGDKRVGGAGAVARQAPQIEEGRAQES